MISVRAFLAGIASIVDERPTYRLGMDGTGGLCDCIGLVIGGIRRAGGTWTGTHGSNWAARNAVNILPVPVLQEGIIALKSHGPGEAGYNLPAQYANHPDKRDYYHVGIMTSVNPLEITHCTSWAGGGGIKKDTALGNWKHFGRLINVAYIKDDAEPSESRIAEVYADSGSTVNMRSSPSRNGAVVKKIPIGESVTVLDDDSAANWVFVEHEDKRGWVMSDYLKTDVAEELPMTAQELARAIFQTIEAYL